MIRLCVMGNSHLAAFKLGWDALVKDNDPTARALSPVFFGAPRDAMRHVRQEDGRIIPTRKDVPESFERMSGGQREIRLADYDAVLLVGLGVSIKRILRFYKTHYWYGMPPDPERTLVSRRFAQDFLTDRYGSTLLAETAEKVRQGTAAPILAVAEPFWASWVREDVGGKSDYGWDKAIRAGDGERLGEMFRTTVCASLAGWATFVPQPSETIEHGILTRAEFNKEASRLISGEGGGTDAAHMNGDFGRAMWPLIAATAARMCAAEAA